MTWLKTRRFSGAIILFNGWIGCTKVAEGCLHCYAETLMDTRYGRVKWGPVGTRSLTSTWNDPLKWDREAKAAGEFHKVFCMSLADAFEDWSGQLQDSKQRPLWFNEPPTGKPVPYTLDHARQRLFDLIDKTPNLHWLILTKRPENICRMWPQDGKRRENVWLGTSISNQKNANAYIDALQTARRFTPVLFLSLEPQIGSVDLSSWLEPKPLLDWVITGGESRQGHGEPRPFSLNWARVTMDQCAAAGVPWFFKQFGSTVYDGDRKVVLNDLHGGNWDEWPEELRVRECPESFVFIY